MSTVLVVDDREMNRELVRTLLRSRGHAAVEAEDGFAALELMARQPVDLVITDVLMPSMDGYELVREMRSREPGTSTPVIFYTANYLEEEARPIAAALGVSQVVTKAGDIATLLRAIDGALTVPPPAMPAQVDGEIGREHLRVLNAKLLEKIHELEDQERLHRLVEAATSVNEDLSLPDTLSRIVSAARSLLGARYACLRAEGTDAVLAQVGDPGAMLAIPRVAVSVTVRGEPYARLTVSGVDEPAGAAGAPEALLAELAKAVGPAVANARTYDEAQRREAWLSASAEIMAALLAADPDEALDLVVQGARQVAGTHTAWITEPNADGLPDVRHVDRRRAVSEAQPVVRIALSDDPDSGAELVLANRPSDPPLSGVDVEMATTFARHAKLALHFAEAESDRRRLSVLEDRDRIAIDLHDVVIQRLFALGLRLSSMRTTLPAAQAERLDVVVGEIDETIDDIRSTIFSLRRDIDTGTSLRHEIARLIERAAGTLGFRPRLRIVGPIEVSVPHDVRGDLVATLGESLSNVARHAGATAVEVELVVADQTLSLRVSDNGRGMAADRHESGLTNLRRRAENRLGTMTLCTPGVGSGLVLEWTVPLTNGIPLRAAGVIPPERRTTSSRLGS